MSEQQQEVLSYLSSAIRRWADHSISMAESPKSEFTVFWIERIIVKLVGYYMNYSTESSSQMEKPKKGNNK